MVFHRIGRGEHVFRHDPQSGERGLSRDATIEVTGDSIVHLYGNATRLWAFNRATVYVHGQFDEVFVLGSSNVHIFGKCRSVDVGMQGTARLSDAAKGSSVTVNQHGTVHCGTGIRVRAYGEARVHAPRDADVSLSWYAQWHTGNEIRGNLSNYRPGYIVVR